MLTIVLAAVLIWIAWKTLALSFRLVCAVGRVVLPMVLIIGVVYIGITYLAIPLMITVGAILIVCCFVKA